MNKIIREICIIDFLSIRQDIDYNDFVLAKIEETKRCAEELAVKLHYPLNSRRSEMFDVDYSRSYFERVTPAENINNHKEMIAESIMTGLPAKYSYIIDGETENQ
jgi:hypothetical protein